MTTPIIEVNDLLKRFGSSEVLNHVNFSIERGESVGLLGENGAGKTTTMRILAGFLPPTSGSVRVNGHDSVYESLELRRCIGYLPEDVPLYPNMRVEEYLRYRARLKGVRRREVRAAVSKALDRVDLLKRRRSLIGTLSKGLRQRVGIADALVHSPPILILDEPTSGLDPAQRVDVRGLISELKGDHTILVSSHILPEVEGSCDRLIVLSAGTVAAESFIADLRVSSGPDRFIVELAGEPDAIAPVLDAIDDVVHHTMPATASGLHTFKLELRSESATRESVVRTIVEAGIGLHALRTDVDSLETIFLALSDGAKEEQS